MSVTEDYRRGFIDGAAMGVDLHYAQWASGHDMNVARTLRDDSLGDGDETTLNTIRYFIAEARMWNQIARRIKHQDKII